jgi:hypothetical protein
VSDKTVYRSTHPEVLAPWEETEKAAEKIGKLRRAVLDELGFEGRAGLITDRDLLGVEHRAEHGPIPEGWRKDSRTHDAIVPDRRRKLGKGIAQRFEQLRMPDPRRFQGMPGSCITGGTWLECGVREMGGALYVWWSQPIPESKVDLDLWERVKLSEYYAAVEAHEAAQAEQGGAR